ncbi:hypothetical protein JXB37_00585 [candidate division WOR-3 bacterium]|nr:hypothetical protein [candidate division WOR-3 bacterium]
MKKSPPDKPAGDEPRCGLCGRTGKLVRTECCGNWVCDDEDQYVPFSYARNSCHRNHRRYTLCGHHWAEGHEGRWQDCPKCREDFPETELYVWYGTNEYNFEKLEDPPKFRLTFCRSCHRRIRLGTDGYTEMPDGSYFCETCASRRPGADRPEPDELVDELLESVAEEDGGLDPVAVGDDIDPEAEEQLRAYLFRLLESDWQSPGSALRLADDLAPDEVNTVLFLDQARRFLRYLVENKGAGLTANGWLKLAEVARLLELMDWARQDADALPPEFKRIGEQEVNSLSVVREVVEAAGLVYRRRGRLLVPKRALPLLEDGRAGALYRRLFLAMFRLLPLDCLYGAEDSVPSLQQSMPVVLWRLGQVAGDWVRLGTVFREVLLDGVRKDIEQYLPEFPELRLALLWHRAIEPLVWFGLVELDRQPKQRRPPSARMRLRKTPLFDRFIRITSFEPGATGTVDGRRAGAGERPEPEAQESAGPVQLRLAGTEPEPARPASRTPPKPEPPGREDWQALYDAAARFKELAPWEWMYDTDMFGVKDPESGVTGYCSVMGKLGQHYCLAAYTGSWGLSGYVRMLKSPRPKTSAEMLEHQDCLMASFEDRVMLGDPDLTVIRELGLEFRGANAWPLFRRYRRGYFPWYINRDEARFLSTVLEQALDVTARVRSDPGLLRPGDDDRYLVRVRRSDEAGDAVWRDELLKPEPMTFDELMAEVGLASVSGQYVEELARAAPERRGTWEFEITLLEEPMQDGPDGQPFYPRQMIVADADSGYILGTMLASPEDHVEKFQSQLADTVRTCGWLPARFLVRNDRSERFIVPLGHALGIPVVRGRLKAVQAFIRALKKDLPRHFG